MSSAISRCVAASLREPLDTWTLDELIGHYVNSRKWFAGKHQAEQAAKAGGKKSPLKLPPIEEFQLYAVSITSLNICGSRDN